MSEKRRDLQRSGMPASDLLEETIALLRSAPASVLLCYFIGAVPFWLGLMFFLSDMSRSADAGQRLISGSLGVALLYLWMKCWQSVFSSRLRSILLAEAPTVWTAARVRRLALSQAAHQFWGLPVRLAALVVTIPFGWFSAYYQNLSVLDEGEGPAPKGQPSLFRRAYRQARLWPMQNHQIIGYLSSLGLFIWFNMVALLVFAPQLLKTFLGIETLFSRMSPWAYLNTTFFTASLALTLLCLDPLWKAAYVLRCFYGESLRTGHDLTVALKRLRKAASLAVLVLGLAVGGALGPFISPLRAADSAPVEIPAAAPPALPPALPKASPLPPTELDQKIDEVLSRREFSWRMPREKVTGHKPGWLEDFGNMLSRWRKAITDKIEHFMDWLLQRRTPGQAPRAAGEGWHAATRAAIWGVLALCVGLIGWVIWRAFGGRRAPVVAAQVLQAMPDLRSEEVLADELPEDGWLQLARENAARGDFALAVRAAWLACLAHLGQRDLLRIARHKSNRDYALELHRRARDRAALLGAFQANLQTFEATWYGRHPVTSETFEGFAGNLETIRGC